MVAARRNSIAVVNHVKMPVRHRRSSLSSLDPRTRPATFYYPNMAKEMQALITKNRIFEAGHHVWHLEDRMDHFLDLYWDREISSVQALKKLIREETWEKLRIDKPKDSDKMAQEFLMALYYAIEKLTANGVVSADWDLLNPAHFLPISNALRHYVSVRVNKDKKLFDLGGYFFFDNHTFQPRRVAINEEVPRYTTHWRTRDVFDAGLKSGFTDDMVGDALIKRRIIPDDLGIPSTYQAGESIKDCAICKEPSKDMIKTRLCDHEFCSSGLMAWAEYVPDTGTGMVICSLFCPTCREEIVPPSDILSPVRFWVNDETSNRWVLAFQWTRPFQRSTFRDPNGVLIDKIAFYVDFNARSRLQNI